MKTNKSSVLPIFLFIPLLGLVGCAYRPARFADAPPVSEIADDAPIPLPRKRAFIEELYYADAYIRRPVMDALAAERVPDARDVNALDDVPRSSWFSPRELDLAGYRVDGPPVPPLKPIADKPMFESTAVVVTDARGLRYELLRDPDDRPEMRTAAAAIASRLAWLFGFYTPEVWISQYEGARVAATRTPAGLDLGPTLPYPPRMDDPNDRIAHAERRSLRALKALGAWLAIDRLGPRKTRESYVGALGRGHVVHWIVGLEDALGTTRIVRAVDPNDGPSDTGSDPLMNLLTLGLARDRTVVPTQTRMRALGAIDADVELRRYHASPPWDPLEHALAPDLYWAAKRIARIDRPLLVEAVAAGEISDATARLTLIDLLDTRRSAVVAQAFAGTSALEPERADGNRLVLRDEAIALAPAAVLASAYAVRLLDAQGTAIAESSVAAAGSRFVVELPRERTEKDRYTIVHVLAVRGGTSMPRACEVHVVGTGGGLRVVAVRH